MIFQTLRKSIMEQEIEQTEKDANLGFRASLITSDPQLLVEKIIRQRIYGSLYWKQNCFAVNAATLLDKAVELVAIGGTVDAMAKPSDFLCLLFKLILIRPQKEIIMEYINQPDFKYIRALGAFYWRLVGQPIDIYRVLEPLLSDYRKLRVQKSDGSVTLTFMDVFIDDLLNEERVCDIILPRIPVRELLESTGKLEPRVSPLVIELPEDNKEPSILSNAETSTAPERLRFKSTSALKQTTDVKTKEEISIEDTNKIRASLGLKPLQK